MQVNPHQMEGLNFMISNLEAENPRSGILVRAPGSWKTFMIINFMQSFLAKSSQDKVLVIFLEGILVTLKKEFLTRQVEDTPLYDFYLMKADSWHQQPERETTHARSHSDSSTLMKKMTERVMWTWDRI